MMKLEAVAVFEPEILNKKRNISKYKYSSYYAFANISTGQ